MLAMALSAGAADEVRETPLSPDEELASFELADHRLTVELVASEPELDSPVAISFDGDGRMFVAEMIDYPLGPTAGRIRLLEDRDADGRYEHATVFAQGLKFPNGVLAARGGVYVTAAPDILFLKDADGDGVAEQRQVAFTGFGEGNQQLRANGLTWGLDNWIYGANGRSDGNVRRPADPPDKAISIRARDFRFRPDGSAIEATSGASQFGQAGDDWGNRFLSWNTIPIRHALFDQRFLERTARLGAYAVRDIADPNDTGAVFPISPRPQTFNRERTDFYNALCGLTVYRGDALGPDYVGSAFVGESLTNLVHRRVLMPEGASFVSRRGEHAREFLASRDPWFHPVYMTTGPDGALYIVDFYRRWVEHPAFVAESLRGGVDWRLGAGHGRIWKVSRRENTWPPQPPPRMSKDTTTALVDFFKSPNGWRRDTAQRLLVERGDALAAPLLRATVADTRLPQAKLHALSTLEALGQLDDGLLLRAMEDGEPHVRQHAMRLAAPRLAGSPTLATSLTRMADFPHPLVRFQLALSMGEIEGKQKIAALVKLANLEDRDPIISAAIAGSLGQSTDKFLVELLQHNPDWRRKPSATQLRFLSDVAAIACSGDDPRHLAACLEQAAGGKPGELQPGNFAILVGAAQGLSDRGQSLRAMLKAPPAGLETRLAALGPLVASARTLATNDHAANDKSALDYRLAAIDVLGQVDTGAGKILLELLAPDNNSALQLAAARALAEPDAETAAAMFQAWQETTTVTRRALVAAALRSRAGSEALVAAIADERILPRELDPGVREALLAVRDEKVRERAKNLFAVEAGGPSRQEVVTRFEPLLKRQGQSVRGAAVFEKHCLTCHSVQGRGQRVGPDLSGVGARPRETVLVDLFDPCRQVAPDFVAYTLLTRQGQVLTGLVVSETATSVTLRRADGAQDIVPRAQIEELRGTGKSLMPEGFESTLSEENVADLLEFLSRPDARLFSQPK